MWPAFAHCGHAGSGRQSEVLSHGPTLRKLAGLFRTALTGWAFLEGGVEGERKNPNISLSLRHLAFFFVSFFFFAKVMLARDFAF